MKLHQLADEDALQGYFTGRVQQIIEKHGKHMVGWDEILASGHFERHRDPILARAEVAGRGGAVGLPRHTVGGWYLT
jgi:N-acetyl-beta-hexosaminidase